MELFLAGSAFLISIFLYLTAALISIFFIKHQKISNITSNVICAAASVSGIVSSLAVLVSDTGKIVFEPVFTSIPLISFKISIDKLSSFFLLALSILVFCVSIYSIGYISHYYGKRNVGLFNFLYSSFILSMIFVMTAGNTIFFFIVWEIMSLISYFLVIFESEKEKTRRAGTLYIIMTHVGTAFILTAFMAVFAFTGTFDISGSTAAVPAIVKNIAFILFLAGFGTKAGVVPVHIWLPHAHPAAPGNISALMSGIMIKTAIYGILRFMIVWLGIENTWWGITILVIGVVSAIIGVSYAFIEKNIKRLLAYSSVENIGIIFIGIGISFIFYAGNNPLVGSLALTAALLHAFFHTLFKGSLFLGAGSVHFATNTKNMNELGGLIKRMPVTAILILGASMSASALIPFNGFISEWLTYQYLFASIRISEPLMNIIVILAIAALAFAGALAAASFIKMFGISFLGNPRRETAANAKEVPATMSAGTGILVILCLFSGLFPMYFIKIADRVVTDLSGHSIISRLGGNVIPVIDKIEISGGIVSPIAIVAIIAIIAAFSLLLLRIIGGKYIERKYGTWDCGFESLNSRMQFTSTGFSKTLKIIFKVLFRPVREITVKGSHKYHPDTIDYKVTTQSVFEKYIYDPVLKFSRNFSMRIKYFLQAGSIHLYLLYILLAVLALMLYNKFA
ncbi:MAG: proton-conducting transporter transmembrane domain-containing protein [Saccharofermentanales bacterium]